MALDIIEAVSGMGVHVKDIPPSILMRQMKVSLPQAGPLGYQLHLTNNPNRPSGSPFLSIMPPSSAPKLQF